MRTGRFLRGVVTVMAVAAVGGAAAGSGGSTAGAPGRIFFSSNRAPNLNPELFVIGVPNGGRRQLTQPTDWIDQASLSPDGTLVVGRTPPGLQVRNADGTGARQLTSRGTDLLPEWSPDGTQVAFLDGLGSHVEVVPTSGGTPTVLDSALTWIAPAWSPDGSQVAYMRYEDGSPVIEVAAADGSSTHQAYKTGWPTPSTLQWTSDGTIVYDWNAGIYSVAADGSADPVELTTTPASNPVVSPDGSRIAYTDFRSGNAATWLMNADGSDPSFLSSTAATYPGAAWSPDGKTIAAIYWDSTSTQQLVLLAVDGSHQITLTLEPRSTVISSTPSWTPDGSSIFYTAYVSNSDRELFSMLPNGKGLRQLTHNGFDDADPAVSPDGRYVAFARGPAGQQQLYLMRAGGGGLRQLTHSRFVSDIEPTWSPDGTAIAFASNRTAGGTFHIYVLELATGKVRKLTRGAAADLQPAWSGDGAWIAFTSSPYGDVGEGSQVWAVRPNGRGLHRIDAATSAYAPAWSPRGTRIAYATGVPGSSSTGVFVQNANGTERINVASGIGISHPAWDPNGTTIAYSSGSDFWDVPADGSAQPVKLASGAGLSDEPSWQSLCTIKGTPGNDVLVGTPGADTICGFGGNDVIRGRGGNDVLIGGEGNDTLIGGPGSDLVFGGSGNDVLLGRDGTHDVLDGGPGKDRISADGHDTVR